MYVLCVCAVMCVFCACVAVKCVLNVDMYCMYAVGMWFMECALCSYVLMCVICMCATYMCVICVYLLHVN